MYNATAYNNSYADSGLFHIQASSDPLQVRFEARRLLLNLDIIFAETLFGIYFALCRS